ncbi:MAG: poly-gamma-glutamate biosynthesis protein PgsC [Spirochaetia bacterium]|jgi:poly-gamma-glutamate biosynthesis protein PgsC/CapC|nr:poly-gamma-glutamate biosynthesis protein PgsC [Spirochaetia bacterium]
MNHETLLIGFVVSMAFYELVGIYPGGIVVPGFLALYLPEPLRLLGTLIVAGLSLGIYKLLAQRMILFGRRRFFVLMMTAGLLSVVSAAVVPSLFPTSPDLRAIGLVVPGLIANTSQKQGLAKTLAAICIALAITALASRLVALW